MPKIVRSVVLDWWELELGIWECDLFLPSLLM
jgi:hypothetical protein